MNYRVIKTPIDGSIDIITSDGGVASFYHNGDNYATTYYQRRLTDCDPNNYVWDELSNGKIYFKDWEEEDPSDSEVVNDALNWLCPFDDIGEIDDTLFPEFFKSEVVGNTEATHWVVNLWTKSVVPFANEDQARSYKLSSYKGYRLVVLNDFTQVEEYCDDKGLDPNNYTHI